MDNFSCSEYIHNDPRGGSMYISGTTCAGVVGAYTLTFGQSICMSNAEPINACDGFDIGIICGFPTPTPSATPIITPTTTATPTYTPTNTPTPTTTTTLTSTPAETPTQTPTTTTTLTSTPTETVTPTQTPTTTTTLTATPTFTPTPTQTVTTTPGLTPTMTPSNTPNSVCPQLFELNAPSPNPVTIPNATYFRITQASGFSFNTAYSEFVSNNQSIYKYTQAPDGNNYPMYSAYTNSASYIFTRIFLGSIDMGWAVQEIVGIPYALQSGVTTTGDIAYGDVDVILIDSIQFPESGVLNMPNGIGGGNSYLIYPDICVTPTPTSGPTPTPTPTLSATPTRTPTQTPQSSPTPTPTLTKTPTQTRTQTPTITASPTETPTPTLTASQTPTLTKTPTQTPTPSTVWNYYRLIYTDLPGGACTCASPCFINVRTQDTWNGTTWFCVSINGTSGFKARFSSIIASSPYPNIVVKTGGNNINCSSLSC